MSPTEIEPQEPVSSPPEAAESARPDPGSEAGLRAHASDWMWAAIIGLAAACLRVAFANQRGFWLDEYYTLRAIQTNLWDMIGERLHAGHSPLYFAYAKWPLVLGTSERVLRLSSALALFAEFFLLTGLLRSLGLRRALWPVWLIALALPYWFTIGIDLRYMMPLVAVITAAAWACSERAAGRVGGLLPAALIGLALWTHSSAQFVIVGFLAFLMWDARARDGRWTRRAALAGWPILLGWCFSIPLLLLTRGAERATEAAKAPSVSGALKDLAHVGLGGFGSWQAYLGRRYDGAVPILLALILAFAFFHARRALRANGNATAWRLLACWAAGIPILLLTFSALVSNAQGPTRYVCAFSVPALICMAVAWNADIRPSLRAAFRVVLAITLFAQAAMAAFNRGDRHREAVQWVIRNHSGSEAVLVSTNTMNKFAFGYLGFAHPELIEGLAGSGGKAKAAVEAWLRVGTGRAPRAFVLIYHARDTVAEPLEEKKRRGEIADFRRWELGAKNSLYAIAVAPAETAWLAALPPPDPAPGPYDGDRE